MELKDFNRAINEIKNVSEFEHKLDAIGTDYPMMSVVAAKYLECAITGVLTDDGIIAWWVYALKCGEEEGVLTTYDGSIVTVKTSEDIWNVLTNKELYKAIVLDYDQMSFE